MAVLPIRIYPDPVLRVRCAEVTAFDAELALLVADMVETMHAAPGVGLAASQVGVEKRVAVVDLSVGQDPEQLLVLVNPVIVEAEGAEVGREGCLSIPHLTANVRRATRIRVEARNPQGDPISVESEAFEARCLQHEIDHLDGLLFLDRVDSLASDVFRRKTYDS